MSLSNTDIANIPVTTSTIQQFISAAPHVAGCLEGFHAYHPGNWKYAFQFKNEEANDLAKALNKVDKYLKENFKHVRIYSLDGREYFQVRGAGEIRFIVYLVTIHDGL